MVQDGRRIRWTSLCSLWCNICAVGPYSLAQAQDLSALMKYFVTRCNAMYSSYFRQAKMLREDRKMNLAVGIAILKVLIT